MPVAGGASVAAVQDPNPNPVSGASKGQRTSGRPHERRIAAGTRPPRARMPLSPPRSRRGWFRTRHAGARCAGEFVACPGRPIPRRRPAAPTPKHRCRKAGDAKRRPKAAAKSPPKAPETATAGRREPPTPILTPTPRPTRRRAGPRAPTSPSTTTASASRRAASASPSQGVRRRPRVRLLRELRAGRAVARRTGVPGRCCSCSSCRSSSSCC